MAAAGLSDRRAVFIAGTLVLAVADLRLSVPVDGSGNLIGLNQPTTVNSWFAPFFYAGFLSCFVLSVAVVLYQASRYRRATGERRQQLKWLGAGGFVCVAFFLTTGAVVACPGDLRRLLLPARADRAAGDDRRRDPQIPAL